jgi:hypothetical protein
MPAAFCLEHIATRDAATFRAVGAGALSSLRGGDAQPGAWRGSAGRRPKSARQVVVGRSIGAEPRFRIGTGGPGSNGRRPVAMFTEPILNSWT